MATDSKMDIEEIQTNKKQADLSSIITDKDGKKDQDEETSSSEFEAVFKRPIFRPLRPESVAAPLSASSSTTTKIDKHDDVTDAKIDDTDDATEGSRSKKHSAFGKSGPSVSPVELAKQVRSAIPYREPPWGGLSSHSYSFDVLKNGSIIDTVDLSEKSYYIFGRLPTCDVTLEHPSLSRYHACIQNCSQPTERYEAGWYLYDLDSTHGTWINKVRVQPKAYHRIRVGHVIKFGGSTRLFILQGPEDDQEEESQLSVTELKIQREKLKRETELLRQDDVEEDPDEVISRDDGCMWGMDMSSVAEDNQDNPFSQGLGLDVDESFYIDDPKKALKNYLDREGFDAPEYETTNQGPGKFRCSIELPVDDADGRPIVAMATVTGKKREAVEACALEACRILDRQGILRAATHESRKRKKKNWEENDFYDSDEDTFLDRTGTIEKKREQRMKKAGKLDDKAETFESLSAKHEEVSKEIQEIEEKLEKAKADAAAIEASDDMDALDAYMNTIKAGVMDTKTRMKLKRRLLELRPQEQRLRKLVNLTRPASLPALKPFIYQPKTEAGSTSMKSKPMPIFGKMKGGNLPKAPKVFTMLMPSSIKMKDEPEVEEEEEDEDEEDHPQQTPMEMDKKDPKRSWSEKESKDKEPSPAALLQDQRSQVQADESEKSKPVDLGKKTREIPPSPPPPPSDNTLNASSSKKSAPSPDFSWTKKQKHSSQLTGGLAFSRGILLKGQKKSGQDNMNFDEDPEKVVWLPPSNQTGDGRTSLNDKYGY